MLKTMDRLEYDVAIDYAKIFGTWEKPLKGLLKTDYMHNLMVFLHELYKSNHHPRPQKKQIFEVFRKVKFDSVRVVILGGEPMNNNKGNGVLFATNQTSYLRPDMVTMALADCIEGTVYQGFDLNFDLTLEHWFSQGVLPIHSTWTTALKSKDHVKVWRNFTRELIKTINNNSTGIIFILLGQEARYYKKFISDVNHYILEYHLPEYSIKQHKDWNCPCFKRANEIIKSCNGKEFQIVW